MDALILELVEQGFGEDDFENEDDDFQYFHVWYSEYKQSFLVASV